MPSLLKSGKPKVEVIDPLVGQKTTAANFLTRTLTAGTPNIPTRQVAGLTGTETAGQRLLGDFAGSAAPERRQAIDVLSQSLAEPRDITQTPEFSAILDVVNRATDDRVNQAIRRTQLEGAGTSSVQQSQVGRELAHGRTAQVAALAPFAEGERNRRLTTADLLSRLIGDEDQRTIGQLGAVQQFGALPRELSQAQKDAQFQAMLQKILFPSTTGADLASRILGSSIDTTVQEGDPSVLTQAAPALGAIGRFLPSDN